MTKQRKPFKNDAEAFAALKRWRREYVFNWFAIRYLPNDTVSVTLSSGPSSSYAERKRFRNAAADALFSLGIL